MPSGGNPTSNFLAQDETILRQEAENTLTITFEHLRFLKKIIETSPTMIFRWSCNEAESVEFVTENVSQLGYCAADFLEGRVAWPSLIHPPDRPRQIQERNEFIKAGNEEFVQSYRLVSHSGDLRWFEDRSRIIRDRQGHPTHIEGLLVDITPRKIAENNRAFQCAFRTVVVALRSTPG